MMKKDFFIALPEIVNHFGGQTEVPSGALIAYCKENNIKRPSEPIRANRNGGIVHLKPLMEMGKTTYSADMPDIEVAPERTDEEILDDINGRFASLDLMTYGVVKQQFRSMIVSGNPGIGKTYTLEYILEDARDHGKIQFTAIRGFVRATGLYKLLYEHSHKGQVLMLDDADSVFQDDIALNLLKGALDSTKRRTISWRTERTFELADGHEVPDSFDFNGAVIFVSNINFQRAASQNNRLAPHLQALMSRSYYLDLNMTNTRELLVRIKNVVANSDILSSMGKQLESKRVQAIIVQFIEENVNHLREISLRTVLKLGTIWIASDGNVEHFKKMAGATCLVMAR